MNVSRLRCRKSPYVKQTVCFVYGTRSLMTSYGRAGAYTVSNWTGTVRAFETRHLWLWMENLVT